MHCSAFATAPVLLQYSTFDNVDCGSAKIIAVNENVFIKKLFVELAVDVKSEVQTLNQPLEYLFIDPKLKQIDLITKISSKFSYPFQVTFFLIFCFKKIYIYN